MTNLLALPSETVLTGDYKIRRVLGAGGFGITYLADEISLARKVTIKEYFPADFAARIDDVDAVPRSQNAAADYKWGLDRFIEEAQILAKFEHANIVRVFRYFRANKTGYMVLQFEEGKSLRTWLKELNRAPRQAEIDGFLGPLLDALAFIHARDFLHRDIAPDNIIIRNTDKSPVLIDFGSARGDIASQSRTVSALVKPGYSPYEQYSTTTSQQGPWTDIYALGATLYQAVTGKRPPDAPTRVVKDDYIPARDAAIGSFRPAFLLAIDKALRLDPKDRPQSVADWRGPLLAPPDKPLPAKQRIALGLGLKKSPPVATAVPAAAPAPRGATVPLAAAAPPPPDAPVGQGQFLDYVDGLKDGLKKATGRQPSKQVEAAAERLSARLAAASLSSSGTQSRHGLGYGPSPVTEKAAPGAPAPVAAAKPAVAKSGGKAVVKAVASEPAVPVPVKRKRASLGARALFFLRPPWRGLFFKLGVGVAVASLAVAYQNQFSTAPSPSGPAVPRTAAVKPSSATSALPIPPPPTTEIKPLLQIAQHKGPVLAFAFQQAGKRLVTVGTDGAVKMSDAETGVLARTFQIAGGTGPLGAVASAAGVMAAPLISVALQGSQLYAAHADGTVAVWDLDSGERLASTKRLDGAVTLVQRASEGERFAAAGPDGKVMVLDRKAAAPPTLSGESHKAAVRALAYVPDRNGLLSTSDDKTVKFWDLDGLSLKRTYRGHNGPVTALDVAPDNRTFASGAEDGQIRLWSAASTRLVRTIRGHGTRVSALAFSTGGDLVASGAGDGVIKVWDVKRGKDVLSIPTRTGAIRGLAFSTDGRRLISAGEDGTVRAWDLGAKVAKSD